MLRAEGLLSRQNDASRWANTRRVSAEELSLTEIVDALHSLCTAVAVSVCVAASSVPLHCVAFVVCPATFAMTMLLAGILLSKATVQLEMR